MPLSPAHAPPRTHTSTRRSRTQHANLIGDVRRRDFLIDPERIDPIRDKADDLRRKDLRLVGERQRE
eukprot:4103288-Alexandrium_andersonii.AAC.1